MATEWEQASKRQPDRLIRELDGGTQEINKRGEKYMIQVFGLGGGQVGRTEWASSLDEAKEQADKQISK